MSVTEAGGIRAIAENMHSHLIALELHAVFVAGVANPVVVLFHN